MLGEGVTLATDGYAVTGADGVGMELTFLGNVVAGTYAVYHSNSHSVDLTVGAAGSLTAYAHSTVRLSASNGVNLANHGTITSQTQRGVMLTDTDGEMTVLFNNTGLISTLSTYYAAVDLSAGTGLIRFDNSGTIQGAQTGVTISDAASSIRILNSDDISGQSYGLDVEGAYAELNNSGNISSNYIAVKLDHGGEIANAGVISSTGGYALTNSG